MFILYIYLYYNYFYSLLSSLFIIVIFIVINSLIMMNNTLKVHYFYSYFRAIDNINLEENSSLPKLNFSVPTGAFGNGCAGFITKKMGLPINKIIIATNENDILYRFFTTGIFERSFVYQTN